MPRVQNCRNARSSGRQAERIRSGQAYPHDDLVWFHQQTVASDENEILSQAERQSPDDHSHNVGRSVYSVVDSLSSSKSNARGVISSSSMSSVSLIIPM